MRSRRFLVAGCIVMLEMKQPGEKRKENEEVYGCEGGGADSWRKMHRTGNACWWSTVATSDGKLKMTCFFPVSQKVIRCKHPQTQKHIIEAHFSLLTDCMRWCHVPHLRKYIHTNKHIPRLVNEQRIQTNTHAVEVPFLAFVECMRWYPVSRNSLAV